MKINTMEMEWTDEGCRAIVTGFTGALLICPRCKELLPRDSEHRCGTFAVKAPKNKRSKLTVTAKAGRRARAVQ
jgi:hypothetical protein